MIKANSQLNKSQGITQYIPLYAVNSRHKVEYIYSYIDIKINHASAFLKMSLIIFIYIAIKLLWLAYLASCTQYIKLEGKLANINQYLVDSFKR